MTDIINKIDGQVQVIFEKGEGTQIYRDAIWMTQDEYDAVSTESMEQAKQQRYDNWLAIINAMPTEEVLVTDSANTVTPVV